MAKIKEVMEKEAIHNSIRYARELIDCVNHSQNWSSTLKDGIKNFKDEHKNPAEITAFMETIFSHNFLTFMDEVIITLPLKSTELLKKIENCEETKNQFHINIICCLF